MTTLSRALVLMTLILAVDWAVPVAASDKAVVPQAAVIPAEAWHRASDAKLTADEIDRIVAKELQAASLTPAPRISDELFLRRVTLDLIGQLPMPADVSEFVADPNPGKRARLIDKLLDSDEFARHWARYWRDVIEMRATALMVFVRIPRPQALEAWFFDQIKRNKSWAEMARAMITAEGTLMISEPQENGAAGFLLAHFGPDAAAERAAETARVFMGIQIQCAQCHDHPSDIWKRNQFHELAAFFGRTRERPVPGAMQIGGVTLVAAGFGEHQMPDLSNPGKGTRMQPKFLNGTTPTGQGDKERRGALADFLTSKDNYWFAGAYVNRIWGELMGQSFYQPVDDMGPQKEAYLPTVLPRLAAGFRGSNYDTKDLFRVILNSETYQRQIRLGESSDQHLLFAASYPTRLRADAIWQSLGNVLGRMNDGPQGRPGGPPFAGGGPFARLQTLENVLKRLFAVDPSVKADEVEGSIPQALILMNNPTINQKIEARDTNLLARILQSYPKDDDALRMVYLRTLARKPTEKEVEKCQTFLAKVGHRAEGFEDILWALINSTEFQTKR